MYARAGFARSAGTRSDYVLESLVATIDGVDVGRFFVKGTLKINRALNDQPDSANFTLYLPRDFPFTPMPGQSVIISNGSIDNRLFGGVIVERTQKSMKQIEGTPVSNFWDINCSDWLFELQGVRVMKKYPRQAAHLIFMDLAQTYCPQFSTAHVKQGSPEIDEIVFDMDTLLPSAFARLATRCDPQWHFNVDPYKGLHFFDTDDYRAQPRPVEVGNLTYDKLDFSESIAQLRNKVTVEGGGGQVESLPVPEGTPEAEFKPVVPGSVRIPVNECGWYRVGENFPLKIGELKIGPQIITFTGTTALSGPGEIIGIPPDGPFSIRHDILQGETVANVITVEDKESQVALKEAMGGDGIRHYFVKDGTLSYESITAKATAELNLFSRTIKFGGYEAYDKIMDTGRVATIVLPGRTVEVQAIITEVEIWFEAPHRTKRRAQFSSAIRVDFTDIITALGKQQQ